MSILPSLWLYQLESGAAEKTSENNGSFLKKEREARRKEMNAIEAQLAKELQADRQTYERVRQLRAQSTAYANACKNRPAGDTPELRDQDQDRLKYLLQKLQQAQEELAAGTCRIEELTMRLDKLRQIELKR